MLLFWFYFVARVCAIGCIHFAIQIYICSSILYFVGNWFWLMRAHKFSMFQLRVARSLSELQPVMLVSWKEAEESWAWCIKLDCANKMSRKGYTNKDDYVLQEASLYVCIVGIWTSRSLLTPSRSCKITCYLWGYHADVVITVVQEVDKMESIENDDKMDLCVRVSFVLLWIWH